VEEKWSAEAVFEEAEAFYDAGPTPAVMLRGEDVDLEDVAGLGVFDPDGAGEGVDAGAVDGEILLDRCARMDLRAASVDALDGDLIAGCDAEARREGAIPDGVRGLGGESVPGYGLCSLMRTVICSSTSALRGRAFTPTAART
jgi:hypothetical protein